MELAEIRRFTDGVHGWLTVREGEALEVIIVVLILGELVLSLIRR